MWALVAQLGNRAVSICFVEPSAEVHLSSLRFVFVSLNHVCFSFFIFFFTLRSAGEILVVSVWASVQAHFHPVLYLDNFDHEPDQLICPFAFDLGHTSSLPPVPINVNFWTALLLHSAVGLQTFTAESCSFPPCCESELPAHLPFLCYSLRCVKCFSSDLESVSWFIPQQLSFKWNLGKILCLSAVILH